MIAPMVTITLIDDLLHDICDFDLCITLLILDIYFVLSLVCLLYWSARRVTYHWISFGASSGNTTFLWDSHSMEFVLGFGFGSGGYLSGNFATGARSFGWEGRIPWCLSTIR